LKSSIAYAWSSKYLLLNKSDEIINFRSFVVGKLPRIFRVRQDGFVNVPQDEQRHSNFFTLDVTSSLASMTMLEQAALPFVKLQSSVGIAKPNSSVGSTLFKP